MPGSFFICDQTLVSTDLSSVVSSVSSNTDPSNSCLYSRSSGIEQDRKFGASWYSMDSQPILLPLVWYLTPTFPSLVSGQVHKPPLSFSRDDTSQLLQSWESSVTWWRRRSDLRLSHYPYSDFHTISLFSRLMEVWLIICRMSIWWAIRQSK